MNHDLRNRSHAVLLIGGMAALLAACGWIIAGPAGLLWIFAFACLGLYFSARISGRLVLRLFAARPLPRDELCEVYAVVATLADRAGLQHPPGIFYVSSPTVNAFSVGHAGDPAIALTSGLLRVLSLRELTGVLAHEICHIRHNDMWVMGLADMISRMTRAMSFVGILLLIFNVPLLLSGVTHVSWALVLLLVLAPSIGTLLQLALSRSREYAADLGAVELTGDPAGLASALSRIERRGGRVWEDIFLPGRRDPDPSVLRSHPRTSERVRRLMALREAHHPSPPGAAAARERHHSMIPNSPRRPRWRRSGLWY